jgi:acetylglutamate kinase
MSSIEEINLKTILPKNGPSIDEVKKYLEKYNDEKIIIKCGGSVLIDPNLFNLFIQDVVVIKNLGLTPIILHGGGKRINNKLSELNVESAFIKGLRVTDKNTIKVVEDVLIEFNKEIINTLRDQKCATKSITTKENNIILVKPEKEELGFVGIPSKINQNILNEIIEAKEVPVITPMGLDKNGQTYNVNADTAAGAIAKELKSRRLLLMTDIEGVMDSNNNLVTEITPEVAKKMIDDEVIKGGMIPKINTCIDAVNNGVRGVVIIDGRKPHSILFELFSDKGAGTLIRK